MKTKNDVIANNLELIVRAAEIIKKADGNSIIQELADNIIESSTISLKLLKDKREIYIPGQGDIPEAQD